MTAPNQPRIVDEAAHADRVQLDAQIRALTDRLRSEVRTAKPQDHQRGLLDLQDLQAARRAAFRREVGWKE